MMLAVFFLYGNLMMMRVLLSSQEEDYFGYL